MIEAGIVISVSLTCGMDRESTILGQGNITCERYHLIDPEMVAIALAIIEQRTGSFELLTYRDRYQEGCKS